MKSRHLAALLPALGIAVSACASNPQRLPVGVPACSTVARAQGFAIVATVENKSDRPISRLDLTTAFYQDFRYTRYTASAQLAHELDPGQKREVSFEVSGPAKVRPQSRAIRCFITHIGYLDGTSVDAPLSQ